MRTQNTFLMLAMTLVLGTGFNAYAEEEGFLTEDELQKAFRQAVQDFHSKPTQPLETEAKTVEVPTPQQPAVETLPEEEVAPKFVEMDDIQQILQQKLDTQKQSDPVVAFPDPLQDSVIKPAEVNMMPNDVHVSILMNKPKYPVTSQGVEIALSELRIMVDMENVTLRHAVNAILQQAQDKSGSWLVKWRLKPDHEYVMREKVNLTAETTFGEFMSFLSERVNNLTGVQLFTRVFEGARVIVISDTYR